MVNFYRTKCNIALKIAKYVGNIFGSYLLPFPSVSGIIVERNKVLTVKLFYRDGYSLPGGMLHNGENFEAGLYREVKEETGLKIISIDYFGSYFFDIEYPTVNVVFLAKAKGQLKNSSEGIPEWIGLETVLPKLVYEDNKLAIKDFLKNERKN